MGDKSEPILEAIANFAEKLSDFFAGVLSIEQLISAALAKYQSTLRTSGGGSIFRSSLS